MVVQIALEHDVVEEIELVLVDVFLDEPVYILRKRIRLILLIVWIVLVFINLPSEQLPELLPLFEPRFERLFEPLGDFFVFLLLLFEHLKLFFDPAVGFLGFVGVSRKAQTDSIVALFFPVSVVQELKLVVHSAPVFILPKKDALMLLLGIGPVALLGLLEDPIVPLGVFVLEDRFILVHSNYI